MNEFCTFVVTSGIAVCSRCGFSITARTDKIYRHCDRAEQSGQPLSLLDKVANFAKAAISHASTGFPQCSRDEILQRHEICTACEHYQNESCAKCGCPITRDRQFLSKLAWADQSCPVGKWGPVAKKV